MSNFFSVSGLGPLQPEFIETVVSGKNNLRVERIVSHGHTTPKGEWYNQKQDEWVIVLEGRAELEDVEGSKITLNKGEHVLLPKGVKHRVSYCTSPCIWLAVFCDELVTPES
ncbi:cupin domain-containing protein [Desulfovibrio sp. OttesenSCG-928-F07]|nr:cupin domain-containing protein [Desulfovibrio sp. OttesenSCG-928-F07]